MVFRRGAAKDQFRPAVGTPPAAVVRDWARLVQDRLGADWNLRVAKATLVRAVAGGLRHSIAFQSNRYNRADEAVEVFTMVSIRSKELEDWRAANEGSVVDRTAPIGGQADVVCGAGLGYLFGTWSDGCFDLLRPGQAAGCLVALEQYAVPWFEMSKDPLGFVKHSPEHVRSINAHNLIEWLLSLGELAAAGDFVKQYLEDLEHEGARTAFKRGREMSRGPDDAGYAGSNSAEAVGWLAGRHGLG